MIVYDHDGIVIRQGHVIDELRQIEDSSVQCVVTGPPYWQMRDYETKAQIWPCETNHLKGGIMIGRMPFAEKHGLSLK